MSDNDLIALLFIIDLFQGLAIVFLAMGSIARDAPFRKKRGRDNTPSNRPSGGT